MEVLFTHHHSSSRIQKRRRDVKNVPKEVFAYPSDRVTQIWREKSPDTNDPSVQENEIVVKQKKITWNPMNTPFVYIFHNKDIHHT